MNVMYVGQWHLRVCMIKILLKKFSLKNKMCQVVLCIHAGFIV